MVIFQHISFIFVNNPHPHHIEGLSAGHVLNENPVVFATTLDSRGPAVFSISRQGHTLIATGEHLSFEIRGHV